jgi:hypothetical protein
LGVGQIVSLDRRRGKPKVPEQYEKSGDRRDHSNQPEVARREQSA